MRDLIMALKNIESANVPVNPGVILNNSINFRNALPTAPVLLDRISELAHESLLFQQGRLEGEPDYYNIELLRSEGFDVRIKSQDTPGQVEGEIWTSKGKITFG